jgi:hypothetical protein
MDNSNSTLAPEHAWAAHALEVGLFAIPEASVECSDGVGDLDANGEEARPATSSETIWGQRAAPPTLDKIKKFLAAAAVHSAGAASAAHAARFVPERASATLWRMGNSLPQLREGEILLDGLLVCDEGDIRHALRGNRDVVVLVPGLGPLYLPGSWVRIPMDEEARREATMRRAGKFNDPATQQLRVTVAMDVEKLAAVVNKRIGGVSVPRSGATPNPSPYLRRHGAGKFAYLWALPPSAENVWATAPGRCDVVRIVAVTAPGAPKTVTPSGRNRLEEAVVAPGVVMDRVIVPKEVTQKNLAWTLLSMLPWGHTFRELLEAGVDSPETATYQGGVLPSTTVAVPIAASAPATPCDGAMVPPEEMYAVWTEDETLYHLTRHRGVVLRGLTNIASSDILGGQPVIPGPPVDPNQNPAYQWRPNLGTRILRCLAHVPAELHELISDRAPPFAERARRFPEFSGSLELVVPSAKFCVVLGNDAAAAAAAARRVATIRITSIAAVIDIGELGSPATWCAEFVSRMHLRNLPPGRRPGVKFADDDIPSDEHIAAEVLPPVPANVEELWKDGVELRAHQERTLRWALGHESWSRSLAETAFAARAGAPPASVADFAAGESHVEWLARLRHAGARVIERGPLVVGEEHGTIWPNRSVAADQPLEFNKDDVGPLVKKYRNSGLPISHPRPEETAAADIDFAEVVKHFEAEEETDDEAGGVGATTTRVKVTRLAVWSTAVRFMRGTVICNVTGSGKTAVVIALVVNDHAQVEAGPAAGDGDGGDPGDGSDEYESGDNDDDSDDDDDDDDDDSDDDDDDDDSDFRLRTPIPRGKGKGKGRGRGRGRTRAAKRARSRKSAVKPASKRARRDAASDSSAADFFDDSDDDDEDDDEGDDDEGDDDGEGNRRRLRTLPTEIVSNAEPAKLKKVGDVVCDATVANPFAVKTTLVVVPPNLTSQWEAELEKFVRPARAEVVMTKAGAPRVRPLKAVPRLKVVRLLDLGAFRRTTLQQIRDADAVITTYRILERIITENAQRAGAALEALMVTKQIPYLGARVRPRGDTGLRHFQARERDDGTVWGIAQMWRSIAMCDGVSDAEVAAMTSLLPWEIHWHRVVADELHEEVVRELMVTSFLPCTHFLGLTGTPDVHHLLDRYMRMSSTVFPDLDSALACRGLHGIGSISINATHWMLNRGMLRSREGGVTVPLTHHVHRFNLTRLEKALADTRRRSRARASMRRDVELLTYFNALGDAEEAPAPAPAPAPAQWDEGGSCVGFFLFVCLVSQSLGLVSFGFLLGVCFYLLTFLFLCFSFPTFCLCCLFFLFFPSCAAVDRHDRARSAGPTRGRNCSYGADCRCVQCDCCLQDGAPRPARQRRSCGGQGKKEG